MRKFKLLKDTPVAKAGCIFQEETMFYLNASAGSQDYHYLKRHVENNPEWFEEIKEKKRISLKCTGVPVMRCSGWTNKDNVITKYPIGDSFTPEEVKLMEAALNGELFTEEEVAEVAEQAGWDTVVVILNSPKKRPEFITDTIIEFKWSGESTFVSEKFIKEKIKERIEKLKSSRK